jgi:NADPH-dependent curcumin reductase CurA
MAKVNRQWLLAKHPEKKLTEDCFEYREEHLPEEELASGEILIQNLAFLCAPTMRNWMDPPNNSLYPSIPIGQPVMTLSVAKIIASKDPQYIIGERITTRATWQDYEKISAASVPINKVPKNINAIHALGRYGLNSLTGYFGLLRVGRPVLGNTVVVSAAAGATGSIAAQVAKLQGCKVIGIAGGAEKCRWLKGTCGLDGVIDYKKNNVEKELAVLCPEGIDIFYDNVGGEILQAAVENMAPHGRIILCGQIASYDNNELPEGPKNMMRLIYGSITMQGFLTRNYTDEFPKAIEYLKSKDVSGEIVFREDVRNGFENIPSIYKSLFSGSNAGALIAKIHSTAESISE